MKFLKQGALALAAAAVLTACGGGGGQIEPFKPKSIKAFGDETSVITSAGRKYTVNATDANDVLVCSSNPIWIQALAGSFGLVFAECNPNNVTPPSGKIYAAAGAKVADVKAQVDAAFNAGGFSSTDLVSMLAGANDVLELYAQYPQQGLDALKAQAGQRGRDLADQVNRIANAGGRVIVATLPDLGLTPFAIKERQSKPDTDRAKLLTELITEFNNQLRLNILNDGRLIGLVLADEMSQAIVRFPSAFGYSNVTEAVCLDSSLPLQCTSKTLVTGGSADSYLWASSVLLSPAGQGRLGLLAQTRALNNPF
ncbi:UNVERIFIED_ORG: hypothetical protein LHJ69_08230 [Shinella sp. XGS7]|nr:SGNH/GDSL hydrolase family protein [Shinella sp. XGS7]